MESKTNKSVLLSVLSLAVMVGSGFLLTWTINVLSLSVDAGLVFILVLTSVFLYVAGALWMGRTIVRSSGQWKYGGYHNGILFALLVIGTGLLLLGLNGGILPFEWKLFFISWPMLLFVLGCSELCKIHYASGIVPAAVGVFFLVPRFPDASFDGQFFATWWPVFIIIGGLLIFFSIMFKPNKLTLTCHYQKGGREEKYGTTSEENRDGKINYKFVFSGAEQVILDPVFKGGHIETVFGGMELDLRRTSLAEGETILFVKAVFGGVEIKAPEDWYIDVRSDSFFGGVVDDRPKSQDLDFLKKLIIVVNAAFGGVTIK